MLPPIESAFATCDEGCLVCHGERWVCADHPGLPWHGFVGDPGAMGTCPCGAEGMPCPGVLAPAIVEVEARFIVCGDVLDEGLTVHTHSARRMAERGSIEVTAGVQQPDGSWTGLCEVVYAAADVVAVLRGMPTPWQRAHPGEW